MKAGSSRELLDLQEGSSGKELEKMLFIVGDNRNASSEQSDDSDGRKAFSNAIPPWKRDPCLPKSDLVKRTKDFLSICKTVDARPIPGDWSAPDKDVIMDVHMGVFDVNGQLPCEFDFSTKSIVDVSFPEKNNVMTKTPKDAEEVRDPYCCQVDVHANNHFTNNIPMVEVLSSSETVSPPVEPKK